MICVPVLAFILLLVDYRLDLKKEPSVFNYEQIAIYYVHEVLYYVVIVINLLYLLESEEQHHIFFFVFVYLIFHKIKTTLMLLLLMHLVVCKALPSMVKLILEVLIVNWKPRKNLGLLTLELC